MKTQNTEIKTEVWLQTGMRTLGIRSYVERKLQTVKPVFQEMRNKVTNGGQIKHHMFLWTGE